MGKLQVSKEYKAYKVIVKGKVQHVGFRYWTECQALKLNIKGFVKNAVDESVVELEVEGLSDRMETFLKAIANEHPYAKVKSIEKMCTEVKGYKKFKIIR